ncbi:MAG: glyoxalase [Frankiales bacterium]|nr:glyoxalase [Frankiales bacterium]
MPSAQAKRSRSVIPEVPADYRGQMEQRISLITLGVADLARARGLYEKLGWHGQEVQGTVFIQIGGVAFVLWGWHELAEDGGLPEQAAPGFRGISLAHNVRSRQQVDEVLATARSAGATITRPAAKTFYGGYAGYFTDLDGHLWEIAHNPGFALAEDGSITVPDFGAS